MKEMPVDAWFLFFDSFFIAVLAVFTVLRKMDRAMALCLASLSASRIVGGVAILLGLPRAPLSLVGIGRGGFLILAGLALARFVWTSRLRAFPSA